MSKNYQYLLFDWDGTLAQTLQTHLKALKDTFSEYEIFPTDFEVTKKVFGDWSGPLKLGVNQADLDVFISKYLKRVNKEVIKAPLYPGVKEMIKNLSEQGKSLALVTTSATQLVEPALEITGMKELFPVILAAEDVTNHKPAAEIIEKALLQLGGTKEEAIIIGDSKSDLGAALNAGIDSVFFSPSEHDVFYSKEHLVKEYSPTFVINNHLELLNLI